MIRTKYNNFLPIIKKSKTCFDLESLEEKKDKKPLNLPKIKSLTPKKKKRKKDKFKLINIFDKKYG
jgi:hypothetical protein